MTVDILDTRLLGKDEKGNDVYAPKGGECAVRLRKRCGITGERIEDMDECPDRSYLI
jgi:hypothetical protein